VSGEFRPGGAGTEWCDAEVLRMLRRRSLAALRQEVEPVPPVALARFLPVWQGVGAGGLRGVDGLVRAIEQVQGAAVPASALEKLVLPTRVSGYNPALLDELCATGEVVWAGHGGLPGNDGWVSLYLADAAPLLMPPPAPLDLGPVHQAILTALHGGYGLFFRQIADRVGQLLPDQAPPSDADVVTALWDLAWAGHVTGDTLAPLRALMGSGRTAGSTAHRARRSTPRGRYAGLSRGKPVMPARTAPPTAVGRWSLVPEREPDATRRAHALAETLLDRHGVVTRGAVVAEGSPGGFSAAYRVLSAFEETGRVRRGYFVEGLGAAQFAADGAVDRLRALQQAAERRAEAASGGGLVAGFQRPGADDARPRALLLAAADPANPYGAALPWPERPGEAPGGHRAGRKAGALVVSVDGELVLYIERGGRSLLTWTEDPERLQPAVDALALAVREGALGKLTVERADGEGILTSSLGKALEAAGFHATPRGLRLRG
jgi:ATP-dependent Lhr-like helicase